MYPIAIVGAGPGDPELLTVKAHHLIEQADVILHDNLISDAIMTINNYCKKIYVGRKFGDNTDQIERQLMINKLLCKFQQDGKKVVRLKSGDPYIYGRAAEEARYLTEHNIPFEVVPGITASLAAASIFNIPITERNKSNANLICTAHTADYSFEQLNGIAHMLKAGNTISIYMGLKSLHRIVPKLMEACNDDTIPVNAVSNASRSNQQIIIGTLGTIEQLIEEQQPEMPVVLIIGATSINHL
ncbi:uroporphyrinogen-III C-methyltransferase [Aquimarina hainanensis]|uniref:uroporphyrinogen-III C-methyltransferase n=1 Tax=Aquimarina hainanensis TaxID=1578017 RepID=A0ABW5NC04_9FLAO|nr:uroporphyrinogen-III C-methyltransferase [Aquimarina sp. TRL1]QKX07079.1 uroporphyrinogen-III C-methyltransferase [Aquimarina sp. TRL1]